jgi:alpha-galactosidase
MAMNVWACEQFGGIATIGLCHGVQGAHQQIASVIEHWARRSGQIAADERVTTDDVTVSAAGINHQTWFIQVRWRDQDMIPLLGELFAAHPTYPTTEKVRIDVLRRFGYYSTESNGHLSEYLPWYRKRAADIPRWIDLSNWIHGETGGYLRVCSESRRWFETDYPNWLREQPPRFDPATRSHEHGSYIIEALETGRVYRGHFNVINRGHITNLPDGCVVEIPGYVDRSGIQLPVVGRLPLACAATCAASVRVQELAVAAAVHGDVQLLKQAMLHDPLVGAVCDPEEVWQMTDELLVAQAAWLPQYADALAGAAARLTQATADGTRVALREGAGAARLTTRSAEQLAADAARTRRLAGSPDRGRVAE